MEWLPTGVAIAGSFLSAFVGIRIGLARIEERHIALSARVDALEDEIGRLREAKHKHAQMLQTHEGILHVKGKWHDDEL
jgi:hypothetical protein